MESLEDGGHEGHNVYDKSLQSSLVRETSNTQKGLQKRTGLKTNPELSLEFH